jgi:hypothetical protein
VSTEEGHVVFVLVGEGLTVRLEFVDELLINDQMPTILFEKGFDAFTVDLLGVFRLSLKRYGSHGGEMTVHK